VVGPIKGYGGLQPLEEGRLGHIDLTACKLLATLGVIGCRPFEDHEAAIQHQKATVLPLSIVHGWLGVHRMLPLVGASGQELLYETVVLV
jgi:hypothetical protein